MGLYLCRILQKKQLKKEVIMWFAVLVFVCLSVEVLSYLSGPEFRKQREMVRCEVRENEKPFLNK